MNFNHILRTAGKCLSAALKQPLLRLPFILAVMAAAAVPAWCLTHDLRLCVIVTIPILANFCTASFDPFGRDSESRQGFSTSTRSRPLIHRFTTAVLAFLLTGGYGFIATYGVRAFIPMSSLKVSEVPRRVPIVFRADALTHRVFVLVESKARGVFPVEARQQPDGQWGAELYLGSDEDQSMPTPGDRDCSQSWGVDVVEALDSNAADTLDGLRKQVRKSRDTKGVTRNEILAAKVREIDTRLTLTRSCEVSQK